MVEEEFEEVKSKSQLKRELQELKDFGRQLIALPIKDLRKLGLDDDLFEAVSDAQHMSHGALKRQTGFIGGLIANSDYEELQANLAKLKQLHHGEVKQFHQLEEWRDALLSGDAEIMTQLHHQFVDFDSQYVRQLVRNASKEKKQDKPPKSARLLFKYLQECQQST